MISNIHYTIFTRERIGELANMISFSLRRECLLFSLFLPSFSFFSPSLLVRNVVFSYKRKDFKILLEENIKKKSYFFVVSFAKLFSFLITISFGSGKAGFERLIVHVHSQDFAASTYKLKD